MAILLKKDVLKDRIDKKGGLIMMIGSSLMLMFIIISNIVGLFSFDEAPVIEALIKAKVPVSHDTVDAYIRVRVLMSIAGNTFVIGTFAGLVGWGIRGKRYGFIFGVGGLVIFAGNGLASIFYSVQIDAFSIINSITNFIAAIALFAGVIELLQYRTRIRQEIARKRN